MSSQARATALGTIAVLLWSALALLTTGTAGLPPCEVLAITFAIAAVSSASWLALGGRLSIALLGQGMTAWAIGIGGLFGYHALYFTALKNAPPAEASLLTSLWPLLLVLLSALLPGERLRGRHVLAAALGLAASALLIFNRGPVTFDPAHLGGYLAAFGCAFTWSSYSVLNRTQGAVPTDFLCPICAAVACLGGLAHAAFESTVVPDLGQSLSLLGLGLGPVGGAFFVWDHGTKHGNLPLLGVIAYAAPVLSTFLLVLSGRAQASATLWLACGLIVTAAMIASSDSVLAVLRPAGGKTRG